MPQNPESSVKTGREKGYANLIPGANKGGRPKQPEEFKEILKAATVPALKTIISIVNDPKAKQTDRIKASEIILDRCYGKATQPIAGDATMDAIVIRWADND